MPRKEKQLKQWRQRKIKSKLVSHTIPTFPIYTRIERQPIPYHLADPTHKYLKGALQAASHAPMQEELPHLTIANSKARRPKFPDRTTFGSPNLLDDNANSQRLISRVREQEATPRLLLKSSQYLGERSCIQNTMVSYANNLLGGGSQHHQLSPLRRPGNRRQHTGF